jgi:murein DD-endopeptidase MepM/ murein hydrolase activator NlpD
VALLRSEKKQDDESAQSFRPDYSVNSDDDLFGSQRSSYGWDRSEKKATRNPLPYRRESSYNRDRLPTSPSRTAHTYSANEQGLSLFTLQTIASICCIVLVLLLVHSVQPVAVAAKQIIQIALQKDYTSIDLPPAIARAFGSLSTSGTVVAQVNAPILDVVSPLHGNVVRSFSVVSPEIVISGRPGSAVVAATDGLVVSVGESQANGHFVTIDHGALGQTFYASLSRVDVRAHEYVLAGQTIGHLAANSGYLTFGYIRGSSYQDPKTLLSHIQK